MPRKKKATIDPKNENDKIAFVISPIGEPVSSTRKRADQILNHVIEPVVSELGYKAVRADKISKPGVITSQIIDHLLNDPLVIADLTGHNPNVFYELAVRHTVKKPIIQMIQEGERIPFDVSTTRTIRINHQDLDSVDKAKRELERQIKAVEKNPTLVDSPISMAIDLQTLKQSSDPESKTIVELRTALQEMNVMIRDIHYRTMMEKTEPSGRFELVGAEDGLRMERHYREYGGHLWRVIDEKKGTVHIFSNRENASRYFEERLVVARRKKRYKKTKRE